MTVITSKDNQIVKLISKLNKSSKFRRENKIFIAEGLRIVKDAVLSGCVFEFFVFSQSSARKYADFLSQASGICKNIYIFSDGIFARISDTKSPQGVLAAVKILDKKGLFDKIKCNGKFIALENLQDPGNMGTVFRTAEALGISGIILTEDCCDIYAPKTVRSTMGAVFRLPFVTVSSVPAFLKKNPELASYAAVVDKNCCNAGEISFSSPCVCVIGNEGNGLTKETAEACSCALTIPMKGRAESLNASVAASILMWEMMK